MNVTITADENAPKDALVELAKAGILFNLISANLNWHPTDLRMASAKSFVESGKVSGNLYLAIKKIAEEYAEATNKQDLCGSVTALPREAEPKTKTT